MSYPSEIRTLIIEDESEMIEYYRRTFAEYLHPKYPLLATPVFAESYVDAEVLLRRDGIYHLVILDLRLPERTGDSLGDASARGLGLIPAIGGREEYPVPILVIVTADPRRIIDRPEIGEQLDTMFWKHWVRSKNVDLNQQLVPAIQAAVDYSGIGIHIVGDESADQLRPMLSPREEDLLRRAILDSPSAAVGADLRWWSVDRDPLCIGTPAWTKVLRGRLILRDPDGLSRERFLKFVSMEEGNAARKSAELLSTKLPHGKVVRFLAAGSRALLVTEKAGPNESTPRPLGAVLRETSSLDDAAIERLATDIVDQLCMLGEATQATTTIAKCLWAHHDPSRLAEAWARLSGSAAVDPVMLLAELRARPETLVITRRMCHGDLHPGNVSVSSDGSTLRAFIIDAGVMSPDVSAKDVAVLEISILLHADFGDPGLILKVSPLFDGSDPFGETVVLAAVDDRIVNAIRMIITLRRRMRSECDERTYVVLLLDYLLVQIGGVCFGTSHNKIVSMSDLPVLFELLFRWYRKFYAELEGSAHLGNSNHTPPNDQ